MSIRVEQCYYDLNKTMNKFGRVDSTEIPYLVFGAVDEKAALDAVMEFTPKTIDNVYFDSVEIDERISDTIFKVRAIYNLSDITNYNAETMFAFDTGGGTKHINQSLGTVLKIPSNAPDFGGAIGVDNDGNINGVDIAMPVMNFTETHYFYGSQVTTSYKKRLADLTGKVNETVFKGYEIGEVLFLGASGSKRGTYDNDMWEITFKFAVSPNAKNLKVGSLTIPNKLGWDYLWVRYDNEVSDDKKSMIKKPKSAYVEKVYERGSFGGLSIGN